ncbi:MAG: DUF4372 domain-containing protein [Cyclobacteriaceae bacterium]|nr:DUF4372 domain-containing protein [Cyclobacteriaceae bacterium]
MSKNTNPAGQPILCQLISFLPRQIVDACLAEYQSDRYYKTMSTFKQLVFLLYGVVTKTNSLNSLCKNLYFLEDNSSTKAPKVLNVNGSLSERQLISIWTLGKTYSVSGLITLG